MKRNMKLLLRLTKEEKEKLQRLANDMGMSQNMYIRYLLRKAAKRAVSRKEVIN